MPGQYPQKKSQTVVSLCAARIAKAQQHEEATPLASEAPPRFAPACYAVERSPINGQFIVSMDCAPADAVALLCAIVTGVNAMAEHLAPELRQQIAQIAFG